MTSTAIKANRHGGGPTPKPVITVVLGDPRLPDRSKPGGRFTPDDLDQVVRLKSALAEITEFTFDYWDDHTILLQRLQNERPEFVLNFCDTGFRNEARYELHIGAYLEMLDIPFSGSGPVALGLCYDKAFVRAVADALHIAVPEEVLISPNEELHASHYHYPVFLKPNRADGSVGISVESIASDPVEAETYLATLRAELPTSDILVQENLTGNEYSVGVIGNPNLGFDFLPVLEVDYSGLDPALPHILDYSSKTNPASPYWSDVRFIRARLDEPTEAQIKKACSLLFERLNLRDYGRFDFRSSDEGKVKLLEINPNPAWCWDGKLAHMAGLQGEGQSMLLRRIIRAARQRIFGTADG